MEAENLDGNPVETFNKNARRYAEKYFALSDYDEFYQRLLASVAPAGSLIDVACGPGNVSAYASRHRPDLEVVGVDLAPSMVEEARARVPGVVFEVCDCTRLESLGRAFDAAAFAFGLSYLTDDAAAQCLSSIRAILEEGAPLLLLTIASAEPMEKVETSSSGDRLLTVYRTPQQIAAMLERQGFCITFVERIASPDNATKVTHDLVLMATRR
ncbi:MAG: class I SAM-dependent methyltransferase [Burkholderiaceae bacterium]|nr:class I SAM-dependent methyltransferase [Burkholderiaceae bacterium]